MSPSVVTQPPSWYELSVEFACIWNPKQTERTFEQDNYIANTSFLKCSEKFIAVKFDLQLLSYRINHEKDHAASAVERRNLTIYYSVTHIYCDFDLGFVFISRSQCSNNQGIIVLLFIVYLNYPIDVSELNIIWSLYSLLSVLYYHSQV